MPIYSVSANGASSGAAGASAASGTSGTSAVGGAANKGGVAPPVDIGPATKVNISAEARARLRAAGAEPADIATTNLKDSGAVYAAIRKARAAHSAPRHRASSASASGTVTATAAGPPTVAKA